MKSRIGRAMAVSMLVVVCVFAGSLLAAGRQIELDRIVARVGTKIVTLSDVRQSRKLLLVADTASDEEAARCLVDRLLLLGEVARAQPLRRLSDADLAAKRQAWEGRHGGADKLPALLSEAGMAESALDPWFRDDLRIEAYLDRQYAGLSDADRIKAREDLLSRLRQRAGLK